MGKFNHENLLTHLKEKWQGRPCPLCNSGSWNISDTVYEMREFHQGNLVLGGGPIVPLIPVTCNNCGNTVLVNALVSKAIEQPKKEKEELK